METPSQTHLEASAIINPVIQTTKSNHYRGSGNRSGSHVLKVLVVTGRWVKRGGESQGNTHVSIQKELVIEKMHGLTTCTKTLRLQGFDRRKQDMRTPET